MIGLSGICVHNHVCHPFLPTWNLPTQVKIPIYLDATLLQTLVGLGFKVLELQNPKKITSYWNWTLCQAQLITSWITGGYQIGEPWSIFFAKEVGLGGMGWDGVGL